MHLDQNQTFSQRLEVWLQMHYHNETWLITAAFILMICSVFNATHTGNVCELRYYFTHNFSNSFLCCDPSVVQTDIAGERERESDVVCSGQRVKHWIIQLHIKHSLTVSHIQSTYRHTVLNVLVYKTQKQQSAHCEQEPHTQINNSWIFLINF